MIMSTDVVAIAIIDLDRRISRALEKGKGVSLSADQLDVLVEIGLVDRLSEAKAAVLKEHARSRQSLKSSNAPSFDQSPNEGSSAVEHGRNGAAESTGSGVSGITPRQRARAMFG